MNRIIFALVVLTGVGAFFSFQQKPFDLNASIKRGQEIYTSYCVSCHLDQGQGIEGVFPPLAKSDYLMADRMRAAQQILYGARGEMTVNGKTYTMEMSGFDLSDEEVSDVLNYICNSWGNKGPAVTPTEVKGARK